MIRSAVKFLKAYSPTYYCDTEGFDLRFFLIAMKFIHQMNPW